MEIIFQHESVPVESDWIAVCGYVYLPTISFQFKFILLNYCRHDYKASFESTWRSDLCITKNLMSNITRCICPLSGTYVVMLTKRAENVSP